MVWDYKFRKTVKRLQKQQDSLSRKCEAELKNETEKHGRLTGDQVHGIEGSYYHEHSEIDGEIRSFATDFLRKWTTRLMVEFPDSSDESLVEQNRHLGQSTLTQKGISVAKQAIRRELQERREGVVTILSMVVAILSLAVAVIALL